MLGGTSFPSLTFFRRYGVEWGILVIPRQGRKSWQGKREPNSRESHLKRGTIKSNKWKKREMSDGNYLQKVGGGGHEFKNEGACQLRIGREGRETNFRQKRATGKMGLSEKNL